MAEQLKYHDKGNSKVRQLVFDKCKGRCAYCGEKILINKFHVDHVEPLRRHELDKTKKGANNLINYLPSCASCNSSKNCFTLETWRAEISKKIERLNRDSSTFRLLVRFGMVKSKNNTVKFYFEKMEAKNG